MNLKRDWPKWSILSIATLLMCTAAYVYTNVLYQVHKPEVLGVKEHKRVVEPTMSPSAEQLKLDKYFAYRKKLNGRLSPLASYSALLVSEADKYGIDYRYVTTIATIESNQCQSTPDRDPYNCWGWGIYPGSFKEPFVDHADGIRIVTRGLAKNYHRKGFDTVEDIAPIYNPNTPEAWAAKVHKIFDLIDSM
jgi:hypothetical protein